MAELYDPTLPPDPFNPWDPRNDPREANASGGLPMPSGGGIIALAIVYFIMLLSTVAAISAVLSLPVLWFIAKWYDWDDPPPWFGVLSAAFFGFFAYFALATLQSLVLGKDVLTLPEQIWTISGISHLLKANVLPVLACAIVFTMKMGPIAEAFIGFRGFLRSASAAIICLWISNSWVSSTAHRLVDSFEANELDAAGFIGLGMLALMFAGFGGIVASIPVGIGAKIAAARSQVKIGPVQVYVATVLALLAWMIGSLMLEFCFNTLDSVYFFFDDAAVRTEILNTHSTMGYLVPYAIAFLCTQLAAFGFAGGAIAWRMPRLFEGKSGWLKASALAAIGVVAAFLPIGLLVAAMWSSGLMEAIRGAI